MKRGRYRVVRIGMTSITIEDTQYKSTQILPACRRPAAGMKTRTRNPESGFALLFVYAMAATIAIMLYSQLPRVVFEAQRDREQLLIDRGEQYSRGIQLYVHKFNRFPADIDALESSQNRASCAITTWTR